MSDLIKSFAFDLQRFADFKGGAVEGEEGITLSSLFNSAGRVWQTTDVEKLADRTYFWENGDAKVSLSSEADNAHDSSVAGGITLVKGVYDTPVNDAGRWVYAIQSVEALDASSLNGGTATFSNLDGVTKIVNANGTIDIDGDTLGGITFSNGGTKAQDDDLDWEVGTVINLDNGNITTVEAAAGEEITTADGTKVALTNGGSATFVEDTFDAVTTFAKDGTAAFDVKAENINISGISTGSEVVYNFNESGDVLDLTFTTADGTIAVTAGGESKFVVANDVSETDNDITIGGAGWKFGDIGDNGGVFKLENGEVTGFVFRDANDSLTVQAGQEQPTLYIPKTASAMAVSADGNDSIGEDIEEATLPFKVDAGENEYTITWTGSGWDVQVSGGGDGTTITVGEGDDAATISFTSTDSANAAVANLSFDEDGKVQSIATKESSDSEETGSVAGTTIEVTGLKDEDLAQGFTINDEEVNLSDEGTVEYTAEVDEDGGTVIKNGDEMTVSDGASATGTFSDTKTINGADLSVVGDEDDQFTYITDEAGNATLGGINGDNVTVNATGGASVVQTDGEGTFKFNDDQTFTTAGDSTDQVNYAIEDGKVTAIDELDGAITGDFSGDGLEVNGQSIAVNGDEITVENVNGTLQLSGLTDGAEITAADDVTVANAAGEGTYTFADGRVVSIAGDSDGVVFQLDGEGNLVNIADLEGTASGDLGGVSINGAEAIGITETETTIKTPLETVEAGDGRFNAVSDGEGGYSSVTGLGGAVTVRDAGGASTLVTNDNIVLTNNPDGRTITVQADTNVTFNLDEDGNIVSIDDFNTAVGLISGNINGLTINDDEEISVTGDDDITYGYALDTVALSDLNGNVTVNEKGNASVIETTGDATISFFGNEKYTISGEGKAFDEGAEVDFYLNDKDNVTAVTDLYGSIAGDFENGVTVNGQAVQVDGDSEITVAGSDTENSVSAIGGVDSKATIVSAGGAEKVYTTGDGVFTFSVTGGEDRYSVTGDTDGVVFNLDAAGNVVGVDDLTNGSVIFTANGNEAISINPAINDQVTLNADGKVTLTTNADGELVGIAGASNVSVDGSNATVAVTGYATVNGTAINVVDSDKAYNVVLDDGAVDKVTDVTGNATINMSDVEVETDADGKFVLNGDTYTFTDSDGIIGLTVKDSVLTAVDSLDGAVIVEDGSDLELTVNGQEIAIDKASVAPVTIGASDEAITSVGGLADGDSISGDLDEADIALPGTTDDNPVNVSVNGDGYHLYDDEDGMIVSGDREVKDLDEESKLIVDTAGTYTVNGQVIEAKAGDTILGYDNGAHAEIYDPNTVLIRKGTDVGIIEDRLGLHDYDTLQAPEGERLGGPDYLGTSTTEEDALDKEETDSILADAADDNYDLNRPLEVFADNYIDADTSDKDTQEMDFSPYKFTKKVHLYRGDQDVTVNSDGGNEVIVEKVDSDYSSGEKNIVLGGSETDNAYGVGDVVIVDADSAIDTKVNITGGAGDDSVYVRSNADVTFDMAKGGADRLITFASSNARVTLDNYDPTTGAGVQIEEPHARDSIGGIAEAIDEGKIKFGDGVISLTTDAGNAEITFTDTVEGAGTLVNLYTPDGTKQGVGFTKVEDDSTVGNAETTDNLILIGNYEGKKKGSSTIIGGIGNDTVFAGERDSVNAGAGNNAIVLEDSDSRGGATIVLGAGNTTIRNTNNTFYTDHGDTLEVEPANISYDGTNLVVVGDGFTAVVASVTPDSISSATDVSDNRGLIAGTGTYANQLVRNAEGELIKMAVGNDSAVIDVKADEDIRANYYKAGGVTFENYNGAVQVDLSGEWESYIENAEASVIAFDGVTTVEAGSGDTTIKGSEANETFYAGSGNTSLYGAGGKNLLVGYNDGTTDNVTKEGNTTFFILGVAETGVNTIESFEFVNDNNYTNNSISADLIEIDIANNFVREESIEISNEDVVFSVENRNTGVRESVLVKDAASTSEHKRDMHITADVVAQVAKTDLVYDKFANFYVATGKNATVSVSNDQDYTKVYLDSVSAAGHTFVGDIHVIDATNSSVTAELAGNDYNNTILAGTGDTSLWGGNFGDDVLIGNAEGTNTFFYAAGANGESNGQDTIQGAKAGDIIDLANNTLDMISTEFEDTGLTLKFSNGGSLKVDGDVTGVAFKVGGDTYYVNDAHDDYNKKI